MIKQAFEMYALGTYTDADIANGSTSRALPHVRTRSGQKTASAPPSNWIITMGRSNISRCCIPASTNPSSTRDYWSERQKIRKEHFARPRTNTTRFKRIFLLNGLVRCAACRRTLRAHGIREKYRYYREVSFYAGIIAETSRLQVHADEIEEQVGDLIERFALPDSWQKEIQEALDAGDKAQENKEKRIDLEEKQRRIADLYADGMVSKENYEARRDRIRIKMEILAPPNADMLISTGKKIEIVPVRFGNWQAWRIKGRCPNGL